MRVLVSGGTGVVGTGTVDALLARGHVVRLLSRHASRDVRRWPAGVEARVGDVSSAESIAGAAEGCDVVVHLAGIVRESPPDITFARVNVEGTRHLLAEAERAGVLRFVHVSSLGAERGESEYHRSKRAAEALVRQFPREWIVVRPGNVYGPGDDQISLLLRMVRTLPAVPVLGDGRQPIQPIWHEDLAAALAEAAGRDDLAGRTLDVAGGDVTSQRDLLDRLERITALEPLRVPLPDVAVTVGIRAMELVGVSVPFTDDQMTMLREGSALPDPAQNALTSVLGVTPTPLDRGLELLADAQAEQTPRAGVGALTRKRYWVDVAGSRMTPDDVVAHLRTHFDQLTPGYVGVAVEPGTPTVLDLGETITLSLPMRGHIQVRVAELEARRITLVTLAGHPLAATLRFSSAYEGELLRFEISIYQRASNVVDLVLMRAIGDLLQGQTWESMALNVARATGGELRGGVRHESQTLHGDEAKSVEEWAEALVAKGRGKAE